MKMASLLPALGAGALMGAMLVFPSEAAAGAWDALSAFVRGVLPGLLPLRRARCCSRRAAPCRCRC